MLYDDAADFVCYAMLYLSRLPMMITYFRNQPTVSLLFALFCMASLHQSIELQVNQEEKCDFGDVSLVCTGKVA